MPRTNRPPKYRHYKPKDLAVVRIQGKDDYLGKYDSPESWRKYYRLISESLSPAERLNVASDEPPSIPPSPLTIKVLCLRYFEFAQAEYVKNGNPETILAVDDSLDQLSRRRRNRGGARSLAQLPFATGLMRGLAEDTAKGPGRW